MNERRLYHVACWAAAVPAVLLFIPLVLPMVTGRMFVHTDLAIFHLPLRRFYSEQLMLGKQFLWSSNLFQGFYVHAEGQVGAFHPFHLLLYRVFPLVVAFNLEVISSYVFAFAGMWLFLRQIGLSAASRTVGAMSFGFSGFCILHLGHPNAVAVAAHLPWLLIAIDLALSAKSRLRAAGIAAIAILTGSQVLIGHPQSVWLSSLACGIYVMTRLWGTGLRRCLLIILAAAAGLAIGGVQLVPTLELLSQSERATTAHDFRLTFSLHPLNLVQFWAPYAFPKRVYARQDEFEIHEFGLYSGALATLAVLWVLLRWRRLPAPRVAAFAGALSVVGLVLALGRYGLVYEWLAALPGIGAFRAPARHILLVHVGLALLTAIAYEDLLRSNRENVPSPALRRWLNLPCILSAVTAGGGLIWWLMADFAASPLGYPVVMLMGVAFFGLGTMLMRGAARGAKAALLILPSFLALDLGTWGYSYVLGGPLTLQQVTALEEGPSTEESSLEVHDATGAASVNFLLLRDARVLKPYVGLYPRRVLSPTIDATLRVAGVDWVRTIEGWSRVAAPAPRARIVPEVKVSQDPATEVAHIDIRRIALVGRAVPGPLAPPERVSAILVVDEPGRLELEIDAPDRALLSLTESYHAGWTAQGDGRPVVTLPLYGDYLGVLLNAGRYRLILSFEPRSLVYGWRLTYAGLLVASVLSLIAGRRPRFQTG